MIILAIESSCDDTSVAILKDKQLLSNIVSSQIEFHNKYGGVMPELASRLHVEKISFVIQEALLKANVSLKQIDYIAFTQGPGLIGSLHVGMQAAKTLALYLNKPIVPIHHLAGHIYANRFVKEFQFPLLALVVSGGNTELVYMKDELQFEILGETLDDAIGEAYDKVSRLLHTGYPGGPIIDQLSTKGTIKYKLPMPKTEGLMFSYSGLKSAVINLVHKMEQKNEPYLKEDIAASFQEVATEILMQKVKIALNEHPEVKTFVAAGGVSANHTLREKLTTLLEKKYAHVELILPKLSLCGDNAGMIGMCAYYKIMTNQVQNDLSVSALASYDLEDFSNKG